MSEQKTIQQPPTPNSRKMLIAMVGIGLMCALLIVLTFEGTAERIANNKAAALEQAVFKVLPGITKTAAYELTPAGEFSLSSSENTDAELVYAGFNEADELVGVAISASGQGYADIIRILYGYDIGQQAVVGMYVLESKETPGLGDKIEKDPVFLENFVALDVSLTEDGSALQNVIIPVKSGSKENPWEVDGITGATISSRAIGNILGASTQEWVPLIHAQQAVFVAPKTAQK